MFVRVPKFDFRLFRNCLQHLTYPQWIHRKTCAIAYFNYDTLCDSGEQFTIKISYNKTNSRLYLLIELNKHIWSVLQIINYFFRKTCFSYWIGLDRHCCLRYHRRNRCRSLHLYRVIIIMSVYFRIKLKNVLIFVKASVGISNFTSNFNKAWNKTTAT